MKSLLKLVALLTLALALLFTLLAAWATWFFDPDDYREEVTALIADGTGLEVEIAGPIEHHFLRGLNLSVAGLTARHQERTVAAIEQLQASISLFGLLNHKLVLKRLALKVEKLDAERDEQGGLNLLPALTGGQPEDTLPAGGIEAWVERVRIDELEVEIERGRYLDRPGGAELKLDGLALRFEPLPILWRTEMVLDDPLLLMAFSGAGELRARSLELGGSRLEELDIAFSNDHGVIDFGHLALRLRHGKEGKPGHIRFAAKGRSTLRLGFDEPLEQLSETPWSAIDHMEAQGVDLEISELELVTSAGRLSVGQSRLQADSLPLLLLGGSSLGELAAQLPPEPPLGIVVQGASLTAGAMGLEEYALSLEKRKGGLDLVVEKGRLRVDPKRPQGQIHRLSARLDGKAHFRVEPRSSSKGSWTMSTRVEAAALQLDELELGLHEKTLQVKEMRLQVEALPLPLPLGERPLVALLTRLPAAPAFKLAARGSVLAMAATRLEDYDFSLGNETGKVAVLLNKGRLRVGPGTAEGKIKQLSLPLSGKVRLGVKAESGGKGIDSLVAESLSMEAKQGVVDTGVDAYRFAGAKLEASKLPLLYKGAAVEWGNPQRLVAASDGAKMMLKLEGLEHEDLNVQSLSLGLAGRGDTLHLETLKAGFANTSLSGSGEIRIRGETPLWRLKLAGDRVAMAPLLALFESDLNARGDIALALDVSGEGFERAGLGRDVQGRFELSGRDIEVDGIDLEAVLGDLERTQNTGLLDLGVYALAGPAGTLLTRGAHYTALLESASREGTSRIAEMHSELRFEAGVLHSEDVAFATPKQRLAVKGSIDLKENGLLNLQIATLDPKGCARYMEEIKGTVAKPEVAKAGVVIKGVITPVTSILGTLTSILSQGECAEPFYSGKVAAPAVPAEPAKSAKPAEPYDSFESFGSGASRE